MEETEFVATALSTMCGTFALMEVIDLTSEQRCRMAEKLQELHGFYRKLSEHLVWRTQRGDPSAMEAFDLASISRTQGYAAIKERSYSTGDR